MTNLFRASNWVSESKDSIVSREVTTCAGMTAHTVVLAQTRVGFLTGGRKKSFLDLEEAYARATVAITRTGALCLIMGPLDMKRHAQAELLPGRLTLSSVCYCRSPPGLCCQLSKSTAATSHSGGLMATMEVKYCPSQRDH